MSAGRTIACPNCGGTLEVRAAGYSVNLACRYCGSLLDVSRPEVELIKAYNRAAASFPLALGTRGTLFGTEWEVIGALKRRDAIYKWHEYLLFNPYSGYRWLVLCEDEWQLGTMLLDRPDEGRRIAAWRGENYTRQGYDQTVTTTDVVGEFYWRVRQGDTVSCATFERGNTVLSREGTRDAAGGEVNWTQLTPLDADLVAEAFHLEGRRMPKRRKPQGAFAFKAEAGREVDDLPAMLGLALLTMVALILAMVVISGPVERATGTVSAPFGATREGVRIGTIAVTRPWQFVRITASADNFENRWIDLDYTLVDRATGQSIDGYGLVEHYTGTDSDGRWNEGDRKADTLLGKVPRGTYDLYVDAAAHGWPDDTPSGGSGWGSVETIPVWVRAETGALPWANWLAAVVLLLLFPAIVIWRRYRENFG